MKASSECMNSLDFEGEKKLLNRENFRGLMKAQIMPEIKEAQIMPEIQEAQIMPMFEIWKKKTP